MARLHHVILPSSDHMHSAKFLGLLFDIEPSPAPDRFPHSPSLAVGGLKLMFCEGIETFHHLAFHVTPAEFDGIVSRVREHGIAYGDDAERVDTYKVRTDDRGYGYRAIWLKSPDATLLEFFSFDALPPWHSDAETGFRIATAL